MERFTLQMLLVLWLAPLHILVGAVIYLWASEARARTLWLAMIVTALWFAVPLYVYVSG